MRIRSRGLSDSQEMEFLIVQADATGEGGRRDKSIGAVSDFHTRYPSNDPGKVSRDCPLFAFFAGRR